LEQWAVDGVGGLALVSCGGGGPGDGPTEARIAAGSGGLQVVDEPLDVGVEAKTGSDNRLHGLVIGRRDRAGHPAVNLREGAETPGVGGCLSQVGGGETGWPGVDDNSRVEVLDRELGLKVEFLRGLRAAPASGGV